MGKLLKAYLILLRLDKIGDYCCQGDFKNNLALLAKTAFLF